MVVYASDPLSIILLSGRNDEIEKAIETINLFDVDHLAGNSVRFYKLYNIDVSTLSVELDQIIKLADSKSVKMVSMPRLNGIVLYSKSVESLSGIEKWLERLDVKINENEHSIFVYKPKGSNAKSLAKTLTDVLGLPSYNMASPSEPIVNASKSESVNQTVSSSNSALSNHQNNNLPRIIADKATNNLIIIGSKSLRQRALSALDQIDIEPVQIFIEASILEVSLNDDFSYGVDWKKLNDTKKLTISSYSGSATNFTGTAPGFTVTYLGNDISAIIRALSSKSKVKIVSAPKISTVENETAKLQVGDQVPIVTQNSQSSQNSNLILINSVNYRDTGVLLEVTPRITGQGRISLEISQEVSTVAKTQTSGIDSPTIKQRKLESKLIVPEGLVVALGGLISSSDTLSSGGVPFLKDMPGIGTAFKGSRRENNRTEVIVLLQVKIIDDNNSKNVIENMNLDIKDAVKGGMWYNNEK